MRRQQYYFIFNTTAGWVGISGSTAGLKRTTLPQPSQEQAIAALGKDVNEAILSEDYFRDIMKQFQDYFLGHRVDFQCKLDLWTATEFQRQVWEAARKIPHGQNRSYQQIAQEISNPEAARAVGQALAKNPLPIIIPCHRVMASGSKLGGFSGGVKMKKYLLTLEKKGQESS